MSEYDQYNFDDDDEEDEDEFEKKIYIDDDDEEEEEEDDEEEERYNEYKDDKKLVYSQVHEDYEVEDDNDQIVVDHEEYVSDYEEKPTKKVAKKRGPKKSAVAAATETPKKKPRKASIDSTTKSIPSESSTPFKVLPPIPEMPPFKGIPSAQENLKKKQIKESSYICPLCSKLVYNRETFERHLLLHDDFLTVLQVYYSEEDPVQCLNAAMDEWKVVEARYLKQDVDPEPMKQSTFKKDVVLFKDKYYEYEEGKRMLYRKNTMESIELRRKMKVTNITVEDQLKWKIFHDEKVLLKNRASKK